MARVQVSLRLCETRHFLRLFKTHQDIKTHQYSSSEPLLDECLSVSLHRRTQRNRLDRLNRLNACSFSFESQFGNTMEALFLFLFLFLFCWRREATPCTFLATFPAT